MIHELKTDPEPFDAVARGLKRAEIRKDDRDYRAGDHLYLRKTVNTGRQMARGEPLIYAGEAVMVEALHIFRGEPHVIRPGYVIISIALVQDQSSTTVNDGQPSSTLPPAASAA